jgi:serine/threonine protein kinase
MERAGNISEDEAILIGSAICDALSYLHTRKPAILHRDIKPGNVKITHDSEVFLVDFGQHDEEIVLQETPLKGDPPKLLTYEIPVSIPTGTKCYFDVQGVAAGGAIENNARLYGAFFTLSSASPTTTTTSTTTTTTTGTTAAPVTGGNIIIGPERFLSVPSGALRIRTSLGTMQLDLVEPDGTTPVRIRTSLGVKGIKGS